MIFLDFFSIYCIQHCFIWRPSDSTVSEDAKIVLCADLSDKSGGASKRGKNRAHEFSVQRTANQEDHTGLHRQGRGRGRSQLWGKRPFIAKCHTAYSV